MNKKNLLFFLLLCCCCSHHLHAQQQAYFPDPDPQIRARIDEWQDLKFGLLMHWGAYSQWGIVESWSICPEDLSWASGGRKKEYDQGYFDYLKKYESLPGTFNPKNFDPDRWADAAQKAGMRYVVFTTKHHDGFCMFDTKQSNYKITDSSCAYGREDGRDVSAEIFKSFRKKGLWTGAYFSKPDWHSDYYWWKKFPPVDRHCNYSIEKYPEQWKKFKDYTYAQINELVSNYGQMDILWLDGGWVRPIDSLELKNYLFEKYEGSRYARNPQSQDIQMGELVKMARLKQPKLIVVDRAVPGIYQNYLTPEQHIPEKGLPYPWETCMTMAGSWSHVPGDHYKSSDELIEKLVDIVSKGGNLLLNIGPAADGSWDDTAYARLQDIGEWMKINQQAIYTTRPYQVFQEGENVRFCQSKDGKKQFIYLFEFPEQPLVLKRMPFQVSTKLHLMGDRENLKWTRTSEQSIQIELPPHKKALGKFVWVIEVNP